MVKIRLGPIELKPKDHATRLGVDYEPNDVIVLAQRPAVIEWNENAHFAAEVNVGTIDFGGTS